MNRIKKVFAFFLIGIMTLSCTVTTTSAAKKKEVANTKVHSFVDITKRMRKYPVFNNDEWKDWNKKTKYKFQTGRIAIFTDVLTDDYGATEVLHYDRFNEYVLLFDSPKKTKDAYEKIQANFKKKDFVLDERISAEDALSEIDSWGTRTTGTRTLRDSAYFKSGSTKEITSRVTAAIIDTGIDETHEVFNGRTISENSFDFVAGTTDVSDVNGHGTKVASVIDDATPDNVEFLVLKINDDETGELSTLASINAALYASEMNADVVNISFGAEDKEHTCTFLDQALTILAQKEIPVVAASGNSSSVVEYPADSPLTIAVSATDQYDDLASFSCVGEEIDFCAPGDRTNVAIPGGDYDKKNGTSYSAPYIVAEISYIKLIYTGFSVKEVYNKLKEYCVDLGDPGKDSLYGWGLPKIEKLYEKEVPVDQSACGTSMKWSFADGVLTLSGSGTMTSYKQGYFPWEGVKDEIKTLVISKDITEISSYAFADCNNLKETYSYASSLKIEKEAFYRDILRFYTASGCKTDHSECGEDVSFLSYVRDASDWKVVLNGKYTYNGNKIVPSLTVTAGDAKPDYSISLSDHVQVGTAKYTLTPAKPWYTGTKEGSFVIEKADNPLNVTVSEDNINLKEKATITASGKGTITYISSNTSIATVDATGVITAKKPGSVIITVRASGDQNYTEKSQQLSIKTMLKVPTFKKLSSGKKKKMTVYWTKNPTATSYKIQYTTDKKFKKSIKTVTVKKVSSKTISKLKSKKTYYVRIKACYSSYSSGWTGVKSVKVK